MSRVCANREALDRAGLCYYPDDCKVTHSSRDWRLTLSFHWPCSPTYQTTFLASPLGTTIVTIRALIQPTSFVSPLFFHRFTLRSLLFDPIIPPNPRKPLLTKTVVLYIVASSPLLPSSTNLRGQKNQASLTNTRYSYPAPYLGAKPKHETRPISDRARKPTRIKIRLHHLPMHLRPQREMESLH
jgi:hypothetical protein